jgi:hypothetical protein
MHQNHHSTQRQYHKEHCKNDYRHNLEPSAAIAFRSAQHNRPSILKLAILFALKVSVDRKRLHIDIATSSKSRTWHPTHPASAALIQSGSSSLRSLTGSARSTTLSFASLIPHHQHDHADHYQQSNDHCNKSDSKHLILPLSPAGVQHKPQHSPARVLLYSHRMPSAPSAVS